jgi:hypothetical protein
MNSEVFSHHEPCPKCGSKDNLGVWMDGHKYCFGCRYYEASPESIENLKRKITMENNNKNANDSIDSSCFSSTIPREPLLWLRKYGLSDTELLHYGILWNTATQSIVFPVRRDGEIVFTNERYFGNNPHHPRYISHGNKRNALFCINNKSTPKTIIVVEDYVSAIKVGRFATALPLLGCQIAEGSLKWLSERCNKLRVWLDRDKASESLREAAKASQYIRDCRSIITELDPKEYSNNYILKTLREYGVLDFGEKV